ncbi:MAG: hypothetical protein HOJ48_17350 [Desulfobacula sp.]|jgi:hypothetical protein|nr:hypothetical protein [Desulfobacula sp.]
MKKMKCLPIFIWIACMFLFPFGASAGGDHQPSGNSIPIKGIFPIEEHDKVEGNSEMQSVLLGGLMVSVFIVTGAGRAYCQIYQNAVKELSDIIKGREGLLKESTVIHDENLLTTLSEYESLAHEIETIDHQISLLKEEV